jgi:hypothetical protein
LASRFLHKVTLEQANQHKMSSLFVVLQINENANWAFYRFRFFAVDYEV